MVKSTTGICAARRRSIIAPLSSDCIFAPPSTGFAAFAFGACPAAPGTSGAPGAPAPPAPPPRPNPPAGAARNAGGAFGVPPGQSAALYVPAPSVSSALTLEMLTRGGRSISLVTASVLVSALYTAFVRVTGSMRVKKTVLVLCPTTIARPPPPKPRPPPLPAAAPSVPAGGAGGGWLGI